MLALEHVTKVFGTVIGVNDVTVELGPGAHGLLGPNGAGKTTLLGLVTGQLRPTMGRVRVFGERPFGHPDVLRRIGFCPAADLTERRATPRQWVRYLLRLSGFGGRTADALADGALDRVGLGEATDRPLGTLSKGMRQRAKLAGAGLGHMIVADPLGGYRLDSGGSALPLDNPQILLDEYVRRTDISRVEERQADDNPVHE